MADTRIKSLLASDWEVRAFMAGTKTQKRILVKPQPPAFSANGCGFLEAVPSQHPGYWDFRYHLDNPIAIPAPFRVGQKVYVKEAYAIVSDGEKSGACYRVDGDEQIDREQGERWKSARSMPKRLARFFLEVVSVRCERLQDITEEDAMAEGISPITCQDDTMPQRFGDRWDATYARRGLGWSVNPHVFVLEFRRIDG